MLTFFIHFGLFARPIIGFQAGFYFAPPPPPTPPPITLLMVLSFNNSLVSGRRFKINSGYFKNGPLEPG